MMMMMNSAATMASYFVDLAACRADSTTRSSSFPPTLSTLSDNIISNDNSPDPLHDEEPLSPSPPPNNSVDQYSDPAMEKGIVEYCDGLKVVQPTAEEKAVAACISHKEAERRRRQRINGHIATLRSLLPNLHKNDKATLLGETVRQVRELKKRTSQLIPSSTTIDTIHEEDQLDTQALLPKDTDEVRIRCCQVDDGANTFVATLSCEDREDLLSDLTRVLKSAKSKVVKAEIATVGGRVKLVLRLHHGGGGREAMAAVSRALRVIVDRPTLGTAVGKRQRHFH